MKIGICDDNEEDLKTIYEIIRHTLAQLFMKCEIVTFHRGSDLLQRIYEFNLLILDIEMPGVNGIVIKERLQEISGDNLIIFVTDYEERMKAAFGTHVLSFIKKEDMEEEIILEYD